MMRAKIISSLEKVMLTDSWDVFQEVKTLKAARGERVSFQLVVDNPVDKVRSRAAYLSVRSKLSKNLKMFEVGYVPCQMPAYTERCKGEYISTEPGLFPDVLYPMKKDGRFLTQLYSLKTLWFTVDVPADAEPGLYPVHITIKGQDHGIVTKAKVVLDVKPAVIAPSDLRFTQWFHCDSIAQYFGVKMQSQKHWKLMEKFIATAARTGVNMLLTPLFTPPLDTAIGTYRPTMQLVTVEKNGDKYTFGFDQLERWVALCHKYGICYFEMSHLFTQWGACATPKIMAMVNGKEERIFGWDVDSDSPEYKNFLEQFLPALLTQLEKLGIKENCYFHISDEPAVSPKRPDYDNYCKAKAVVKPLLQGCNIMDALSHVEFFDNGLIECPVAATDAVEPFLERDIKERWCYYCCSQTGLVANRFMAMPSYRNRVSGLQLYLHDMDGFLHWGYNFYGSKLSDYPIDPYQVTDGIHGWPSGDPFSVYPYENGAIESIRTVVFYEGLQDRMLLKALENKLGKEQTKAQVRAWAGNDVNFKECLDAKTIQDIHDKVLELL